MQNFKVRSLLEHRSNLIPIVGNIKIISENENITIGRDGPTGSSSTEYGYVQNFSIVMGNALITPVDMNINVKSIVSGMNIYIPPQSIIYNINFCSNCTTTSGSIVLHIGGDVLPPIVINDYDQKYTEYKILAQSLPRKLNSGGVVSVEVVGDTIDGEVFFDIFYI